MDTKYSTNAKKQNANAKKQEKERWVPKKILGVFLHPTVLHSWCRDKIPIFIYIIVYIFHFHCMYNARNTHDKGH